ncbi:MAG: methionine adenosyltransferase [Candidatus Woesearchaeota archaeon]
MVNLVIDPLEKGVNKVEMVEVKGLGHPDTLADALAEESSKALSRFYLKRFRKVAHHNIDKALIVGGKSDPKFKDGKIIEPMRIIIAGRATSKVGNIAVPVKDIITEAVEAYMKRFDGVKYKLDIDVKEGATNLKEVFKRSVAVANDTSLGTGFYPLTILEKLVKDTADHLVSKEFRNNFRAVGYDVKVMGVRDGYDMTLTIAMAFIGKYVKDMDHYKELKHNVKAYLENRANIPVHINTLDSFTDESTIYLTVSGLSAEMGDDGQAGRGNRYNGMITPYRPMNIESVAGKNVSHPGKLYNAMADRIAKELVEKAKVESAEVYLVTEIGKPLNEPYLVSVKILGKYDAKEVQRIVDINFAKVSELQSDLINS